MLCREGVWILIYQGQHIEHANRGAPIFQKVGFPFVPVAPRQTAALRPEFVSRAAEEEWASGAEKNGKPDEQALQSRREVESRDRRGKVPIQAWGTKPSLPTTSQGRGNTMSCFGLDGWRREKRDIPGSQGYDERLFSGVRTSSLQNWWPINHRLSNLDSKS
jgi:hypothetical protein